MLFRRFFTLIILGVFFVLSPLVGLGQSFPGKRADKEIVVSTWNIGHFSKGMRPYSHIKSHELQAVIEKYNTVLNDSIRADVLCFNEFSKYMTSDNSAKKVATADALFKNFDVQAIGKQKGFNCNALFAKTKVRRIKEISFKRNLQYIAKVPRSSSYYYLSSDLYLDGHKIKFLCVHTISRNHQVCQAQIAELIQECEKYDRVIMCGDWNTETYNKFRKAGYTLANDGSLKTYPKKSFALDNIIVKGVKVSDVRVVKTDLSDHYPLVCRITIN